MNTRFLTSASSTYKLKKVIGRGGYGKVHKAKVRQSTLDRLEANMKVVIKI